MLAHEGRRHIGRFCLGALFVAMSVLPLWSRVDTWNLKATTNERGVVAKEWLGWKDQDPVETVAKGPIMCYGEKG